MATLPAAHNSARFAVVRLLPLALLGFFLFGCGLQAPPPVPKIDFDKAKAISDGVADELVKKDINDLYQKLDVGFHLIVKGPGDLKGVVEKMDELYGNPLKYEYKMAQSGIRTDETWQRPTRTFFYAVKTTKYPMGKYFLKVEVVRAFDGGFLDVSGFGFFTFKEGTEVPDYLK